MRGVLCFLLALIAFAGAQASPNPANSNPNAPVTSTLSLLDTRSGSGEPTRQVAPGAISGFNFGNMMLVAGFEEDFGALGLRALRFPPGNQADEVALTADVVRR